MTKPPIFLTLKGHIPECSAANPGCEVWEIDLNGPLYLQTLYLPMDRDMGVYLPQRMSEKHKMAAFERIEAMLIMAKISHNTHERLMMPRYLNCMNNKERMAAARPLHELKRVEGKNVALIVGNGPSLQQMPKMENVAYFTCWHSTNKLLKMGIQPHAVMHCDTRPPHIAFEEPKLDKDIPLIATPSVCSEFLKAYPDNPLYAYYSQEVPMHAYFAAMHNSPDHAPINGTVANGLVRSAIYAGYKRIALIGVDLSSSEPFMTEQASEDEQAFKVHDKHGNAVYSSHMYQAYKLALELIPPLCPDITFENWGKTGVTISGFKDVS